LKPVSGHRIESSNTFWKFSAGKLYNEVLGAVSRFLRLKTKLFAVKFRCIFCVIRLQTVQKCFGRIFTIIASKAKTKLFAVKSRRVLEIFTLQLQKKEVLGAFSRYLRPETKVFPVKFRRILEFLCLQVLQKKFWGNFTICAS